MSTPFRTWHLPFAFLVFSFVACLAGSARAELTFDDGQINVVDFSVTDFIGIRDSVGGTPTTVVFDTGATITGTDVDFDETVYVFDQSRVIINDGFFIDDLATYFDSRATINGGELADDVVAYDDSVITINGGEVGDDVHAFGGEIIINGGVFGEDIEADGGRVVIQGGTLFNNGPFGLNTGFGMANGGVIELRGSEFFVNGTRVNQQGEITDPFGIISGTLLDGSVFFAPFDRTGGGGGGSLFVATPEPTSATLLCCALAAMAMRKRR